MREITEFVNLDLGISLDSPVKISQVRYIVRKLRGHDIVEKLLGRNRYQLTVTGHCFTRMFVTVIAKVILPFSANVDQKSRSYQKSSTKVTNRSSYLVQLGVLYDQLDTALSRLVNHVDIEVGSFV